MSIAEILKSKTENLSSVLGSCFSGMFAKKNTKYPLKYKSVKDLPTTVRIETSTLCDLRCPLCWQVWADKSGFKRGYLKFEDFKRFVDRNSFIKHMEIANNGEIFTNPELYEIIKYSHEKDITLSAMCGVNLNHVSDKVLEALVKYELRDMMISLDGASQETYVQYRVGGNFDTVISNIRKINAYKEQYKTEFPRLYCKMTIFSHNEHEISQVKELAKDLKAELFFAYNTFDSSWHPIKDIEKVKKEIGHESVWNKPTLPYLPDLCSKFWDCPQIEWDGKLRGCGCCSASEQLLLDEDKSAFDMHLLDLLNSPKYIYAKKMILGMAPPRDDMPCTTCPQYETMKKINNWVQ